MAPRQRCIVGRVAQALLTQGRVRRGYLGVSTQPVALPSGLTQGLGLSQASGLLIVGVEAGSPADRGGLTLGDVIAVLTDAGLSVAESGPVGTRNLYFALATAPASSL